MAYVARPSDFHGAAPYKAAALAPVVSPLPEPRGFWRRLVDRYLDAHQQDAEDAVADYISRRGKLTDSMEREIADRFATGNWGPRQ